jgi:hypothetical protein
MSSPEQPLDGRIHQPSFRLCFVLADFTDHGIKQSDKLFASLLSGSFRGDDLAGMTLEIFKNLRVHFLEFGKIAVGHETIFFRFCGSAHLHENTAKKRDALSGGL